MTCSALKEAGPVCGKPTSGGPRAVALQQSPTPPAPPTSPPTPRWTRPTAARQGVAPDPRSPPVSHREAGSPQPGRGTRHHEMPQSNPRRRPHGQSRRSQLEEGQNQQGRPEGKGRPMNGPFPCPHHPAPTTTTPAGQPQSRTPPAQPARPPRYRTPRTQEAPQALPHSATGTDCRSVQRGNPGPDPTTPPPPPPVEPEATQAPGRHRQPPVKRPRAQPQAPATHTAKGPTKPNAPTTPGAGPTTRARSNPKGHPRITARPL
ncbi:basic proline-rich protein-like [Notolabrus celidotus]|uniref:basic proline-rich protein-like n=1 Tax=Notolabrus celidotus TaxID=1203425 RepID=UPI00148F77E7|nr:basic proline-rich protein-like [Notolabrus celidotus]